LGELKLEEYGTGFAVSTPVSEFNVCGLGRDAATEKLVGSEIDFPRTGREGGREARRSGSWRDNRPVIEWRDFM
jgi:hypothetical protein